MESILLSTKVRIPTHTHRVLWRPQLIEILEEGVTSHKVTVVLAPAGSGKTTLLSQWASASHVPTAWLALGDEDNELERFFRYLLESCRSVEGWIV